MCTRTILEAVSRTIIGLRIRTVRIVIGAKNKMKGFIRLSKSNRKALSIKELEITCIKEASISLKIIDQLALFW